MLGDEAEQQTQGRRTDMPGTFEWRLLQLERERESHESRLREVEGRMNTMDNKLDSANTSLTRIEERMEEDRNSREGLRNRIGVGFLVTIGSVLATYVAEHLHFHP